MLQIRFLYQKKITAEVCIHHLWFTDKGMTQRTHIKWNHAIKSINDKDGLWKALLDDRIDVIATDHAPHTLEEKNNSYLRRRPRTLVQHALPTMLRKFFHRSVISLEKIVEKCVTIRQFYLMLKKGAL